MTSTSLSNDLRERKPSFVTYYLPEIRFHPLLAALMYILTKFGRFVKLFCPFLDKNNL